MPSVPSEAFGCFIGWKMPSCFVLSRACMYNHLYLRGESMFFSNMQFFAHLVPALCLCRLDEGLGKPF